MNTNTPSIYYQIIFAIIVISIIIFYTIDRRKDAEVRLKNSYTIFGTYQLDLKRTEFGAYAHDSLKYKNLQITFKKDMTFSLNMQVPFFLDTTGKWNAAGNYPDAWNWIYYRAWGYGKYKIDYGNPFSRLGILDPTPDSIFEVPGATPQKGKPSIQEMYFKKITNGKKRLPLFSPLQ